MKKELKMKLKLLFENLCCSKCYQGFDEDSFYVQQQTNLGLIVITLKCKNCGTSFGIALVGITDLTLKDPFNYLEPINYNDVLDAHKFIQKLDEHWQDYLPKKDED